MGSNSSLFYDHPLISSIITLYLLIFLYFPNCLIKSIFHPILISTLILLLFILRLGVSQQTQYPQLIKNFIEFESKYKSEVEVYESKAEIDPKYESESITPTHDLIEPEPKLEIESKPNFKINPKPEPKSITLTKESVTKIESSQDEVYVYPHYDEPQTELEPIQSGPTNKPDLYHKENFVEWDVGGPLEVIYEGQEDDEETQNDAFLCNKERIERYPLLSRYYPESDTDTDTDTDTGSSSCSLDDEFEEKEGMFEIALDYGFGGKIGNVVNKVKKEVEFDEEDNLIEIDISPCTNECLFNWY